MTPKRIAYLMSRFPNLSETFILREMIALRDLGWEIDIYPIILQHPPVIHPEARPWLQRVHHSPYVSFAVLTANLRALFRSPRLYFRTALRVLRENASNLNFFVRALALFPKAVLAAEQIQRQGIQHIHAHYASHPALFAWIIHQFTGIPYSITVHAHDIFVRKAMLATKLADARFIISISEFNRAYLSRLYGAWVEDKTHIIHCGVEPQRYPPHAEPPTSLPGLQILSIGSLQPYKGQKYLVEACALLRTQQIPFECQIIGAGELQTELQTQIQSLGLENQVRLLGPQNQQSVAEHLAAANVYAQPSIITPSGKMEGIPVSIMEALACALPVVATELSGIPELVRPFQTGQLVPPENPEALAEALAWVYQHPQEAHKMALRGRELVMEQFTLTRNAAALAAIFEETVKTRPD